MKDPNNNSGENAPKGTIKAFNGRKYKSLGNGNWEGFTPKKPDFKMTKMKPNTNYKSTSSNKGKPRRKRESGW